MPLDAHRQLAGLMMMPQSETLARIWEMLADGTDAALLLCMPGTANELAARSGLSMPEVERRIAGMFHRGVVFETSKPNGAVFRPPRHLVQLHDASNQWPEAPLEFFETWTTFMHEEFPAFVAMALAAGTPPFMRAVPNFRAVERLGGVDPSDDLARMIDEAEELAVCNCPCQRQERACDRPIERCLQLNRGARYVISRGTGRAIAKTEALDLLRRLGDAGHVHLIEYREGQSNVICNCCSCCCAIIRPARTDPACRPMLAHNRYRAAVEAGTCVADGLCNDACPMTAIRVDGDSGHAVVDDSLCIGCGACMTVCPTGAIALAPRN